MSGNYPDGVTQASFDAYWSCLDEDETDLDLEHFSHETTTIASKTK